MQSGVEVLELSNRPVDNKTPPNSAFHKASDVKPGMSMSGVIVGYGTNNSGIWVMPSPSIKAFVPGLELSSNPKHLNKIEAYYPIGSRISVYILRNLKKTVKGGIPSKTDDDNEDDAANKKKSKGKKETFATLYASVLRVGSEAKDQHKPNLLVGRIDRQLSAKDGPALMLTLRGGHTARCCITELEEPDEWMNMPLGRLASNTNANPAKDPNVVTDEEDQSSKATGKDNSASDDSEDDSDEELLR